MLSKNPLKGRIIFPIRDEEGILKGFAGRIATEHRDSSPKYLNTTAATGFERANLLYGLHRARKIIAETGTMYITEGYKDAIAMHAAGFTNTVSLCGTILAPGQIALIRKYARKVYLVMDVDRAGKEATTTIRRQLAGVHIEVKTVILPDGEDPDSLFRSLSKNSFKEYIFATGIPAGIPEYLIVTACLLFPEAKLRTGNGEQHIFEILLSIIETDRLPLEKKDHRELLDCLSCSNAEEISSGKLATLAGQLKATHDPAIQRLYDSYLGENN